MRTLELLKGFTPKELKEIETIVKRKKRQTLPKLLQVLRPYIKKDKVPENKELYQKVFGGKYEDSKGNTIRNELRLLNEILYDFLVMARFKQQISSNPTTYKRWLAEALFDRNLLGMLGQEIDGYIEQSKKDIKPDDTATLQTLKWHHSLVTEEKNPKSIYKMMALLDDIEQGHIRALKYKLRRHDTRRVHTVERLSDAHKLSDELMNEMLNTEPKEQVDIPIDPDDWLEQYFINWRKTYEALGDEALPYYKNMTELMKNDVYETEIPAASRVKLRHNYALTLISAFRLKEADEQMNQILHLIETKRVDPYREFFQNSISIKLFLGNYQDGIDIYHRNETFISSSINYVLVAMSRCYCYLFLGEVDKALESIPEVPAPNKLHNFMKRLIFVVAFCIRKDYELAHNECINLGKMLSSFREVFDDEYHYVLRRFNEYTKLKVEGNSLQSLEERLRTEEPNLYIHRLKFYAFHWLMEDLNIPIPAR